MPIQPTPIDIPTDTGRPAPRRMQYPVGWNLPVGTPGTEGLKLAPFATLRAAADMFSVARSCIDKRKAEILGLAWDIVPTDEAEHALQGDDPESIRAREDWDQRRAQVMDFFTHPDADRAKYPTTRAWLAGLLEDLFVVDAVAVYKHPPRRRGGGPFGSDLASLDLLDGTTIRPLLDLSGTTPPPPAPGYQQYIWGVPRVDLLSIIEDKDVELLDAPVAEYRSDQLLYLRAEARDWTPYGMSPLEKAMLPIAIGLARQQWQWDYYQDGSIPGMFVTPGPDISTPQQIRQLQDALNAMAGDIGSKHRIIVFPPGSEAHPQKPPPLADQFDEWIISQVAMPFGLTPMDLGVTPRVSAVQSPSESRQLSQINTDKGVLERIEPTTTLLKTCLMDYVIQEVFGQKDMEWSWGLTDRGESRDDKIRQQIELTQAGLASIDEGRMELGKPPWGLPETSVPLLMTATGPVPLSQVGEQQQTPDGQPPKPGAEGQQAKPAGELTTPQHEAAEDLDDTPDKGAADPAPDDAQQQMPTAKALVAELEILERHLTKRRPLADFVPKALVAEDIRAAGDALGKGVAAAVAAAGAAALRRLRQTTLAALANDLVRHLTDLLRQWVGGILSLPQAIDGMVAAMGDGYRQTMEMAAGHAAADHADTRVLDPQTIDAAARQRAQEQRGYLIGLTHAVTTGQSADSPLGGLPHGAVGEHTPGSEVELRPGSALEYRIGLYGKTLHGAYQQTYGTTVQTSHPDYEIVWVLGETEHCEPCKDRAGRTFTFETLPGYPGNGEFGGPLCEGGPLCGCSLEYREGGEVRSVITNTQREAAKPYYQQQLETISAHRDLLAQNRADFVASLPDNPHGTDVGAQGRAMTRDDLRRQVADLANRRIRAVPGGYSGVSVEPEDIPARIIAQLLPPGAQGADRRGPRIDVATAVEQVLAARKAAKNSRGTSVSPPPSGSTARAVWDQLAEDFPTDKMGWITDLDWSGPKQIPLADVDFGNAADWQASHEHHKVREHADRIQGGHRKPVILVDTPGDHDLMVVDGHHRALAYRQLDEPVTAYVGKAAAATGPWDEFHSYQHHGQGLTEAAPIAKVGPHGYVHGWHFVGIPGVGDRVHGGRYGHGTVTGRDGATVHVRFDSGQHHSFHAPQHRQHETPARLEPHTPAHDLTRLSDEDLAHEHQHAIATGNEAHARRVEAEADRRDTADAEAERRRLANLDEEHLGGELSDALTRGDHAHADRVAAELDRRDEADRIHRQAELMRQPRPADRAGQDELYDRLVAAGANPEEAYAHAHGVGDEDMARHAVIAQLRSQGYTGAGFDALTSAAFRDEADRRYLAAEDATNGYLLNAAGQRAGIDPRSLFEGPESRARKYASDELKDHWDTHGRLTLNGFRQNALGRAQGHARGGDYLQ